MMATQKARPFSSCRERVMTKAVVGVSPLLLIVLLVMIQVSCRKTESLPAEGVTRELARQREAQITDLRYHLRFEIVPGTERIKAHEEIHLQLNSVTAPVVLDFRDLDPNGKVVEGKVSQVAVNGQAVNQPRQANGHIVIPGHYFQVGQNTLTLSFESGMALAGRPITRYKDSDDGSEYVYTLFVPMDASLAFPCFDQPDLKARFTLDLIAPEAWTVVSNSEIEQAAAAERPGFRRTSFRETRPISTYLFAFAAGPLREVARHETPVPMRIFVRQSKLQRGQEEAPEIARYARDGVRHLAEFFAQPFPFPKSDLILIPGFPYGGMEHAGATFLNEDAMIFPTTPTPSDKLGRAEVLLHELAHQWFGNLVTMRWFDDLWLKEGFATYMSSEALAALTDPNNIWKRFYLAKRAAYTIDATKGTTPIYQEVRNLKDAKSAYGAIVYAKAPGLLRYLSFVLGEPAFRDGVRRFLKEHAYANAEWRDLIQAFEQTSGQSLERWAAAWVQQRGMPQLEIACSCNEQGRVDRFTVAQRNALGEGHHWPIKTQLFLAYDKETPLLVPAQFEGDHTEVSEVIGKKCPAYVFGNYSDYSYGGFLLDARSQKAVSARLGTIADPFLRTLLWGALWDTVREAEMPPMDYLTLALKLLPAEKDEALLQTLLGRLTTAFHSYLSSAQQAAVAPQLEAFCYDQMMKAPEQGLRITYFRAFNSVASTVAARNQLKSLLAGKVVVPGMELKSLDRWRIIRALLANHDEEAEALLAAERLRDQSDDGRRYAYMAEAARADAETKRRYFEDYLRNPAVSEDWVEESLGAFNSSNQSALTLPYLKPALEALPQIKRERKIFFALNWLNTFIGGQQTNEALAQVQDVLRSKQLDSDLELKVLEVVDDLERTVRIRAKFSPK
jgi:aminopeptidase N